MLLAELEDALIHVSLLIDTYSLTVSVVFKPFAIVFPVLCHFLTHAIADALKPLTVVDVHICRSIVLSAECAVAMVLIIQELAIVSHFTSSIEVESTSVSLALA